MRLLTLLPFVLFFSLIIILVIYLWQINFRGKDITRIPSNMLNQPIPVFNLPPITVAVGRDFGGGLKKADLKNGVKLVNFWASWCLPCKTEHPILMALAEQGTKIYGINVRDEPHDAFNFLQSLGNPYTKIGADKNGRVSIDWGVYGYPETFIVDAKNRIRYRHVGPIHPEELQSTFQPLLQNLTK